MHIMLISKVSILLVTFFTVMTTYAQVRQPNIGKAIKYLNWKPKIKIDDGLKITMEYFRTQLKVKSD